MRKGWYIEKVKEHCLALSITRWYLQAPSGNKYYMYRGCHFSNRVYIPTAYKYFIEEDFASSRSLLDLVTLIYSSGKSDKNNRPVNDSYKLALKYIYSVEESGGFADQDKINAYLENNKEYRRLYES